MVACKFLYEVDEEDGVFNDEWAKAGLVTVQWMNKLEKDFLAAIVSIVSITFKPGIQTILCCSQLFIMSSLSILW